MPHQDSVISPLCGMAYFLPCGLSPQVEILEAWKSEAGEKAEANNYKLAEMINEMHFWNNQSWWNYKLLLVSISNPFLKIRDSAWRQFFSIILKEKIIYNY